MNSELIEIVNPRHSAVIVIGVHNDACHPEGHYAKRGLDISLSQKAVRRTIGLIEEARRHDVPIIFTKSVYGEWYDSPALKRIRKRTVQPFVEGTWGAEFYEVQPRKEDLIVVKHRYSAFVGTDLDMTLRSRRIGTLILTGGGVAACVESTARDGFMLNYEIVAVSDCCGTSHPEQHESALRRMGHLCATVAEAQEIFDAWNTIDAQVAVT